MCIICVMCTVAVASSNDNPKLKFIRISTRDRVTINFWFSSSKSRFRADYKNERRPKNEDLGGDRPAAYERRDACSGMYILWEPCALLCAYVFKDRYKNKSLHIFVSAGSKKEKPIRLMTPTIILLSIREPCGCWQRSVFRRTHTRTTAVNVSRFCNNKRWYTRVNERFLFRSHPCRRPLWRKGLRR